MGIKWVEVREVGTRRVVATMCMQSWLQLPIAGLSNKHMRFPDRIYNGMRVYAQGLLSEKK